jgi:hypothetical protein
MPTIIPYQENSMLRDAYCSGYTMGWQIMKDGGLGDLAYAPDTFSGVKKAEDAWNHGLSDGKRAAYEQLKKNGYLID